jgi:hypothetical protein
MKIFLVVVGYFGAVYYLIKNNKFFKEFYGQLNSIPAFGYGDSAVIFNISAPLIFMKGLLLNMIIRLLEKVF